MYDLSGAVPNAEGPANYFKHERAIVSPGASIGAGTRIWAFVNIQDNAIIGEGCQIADGCFIEKGAVIGNHVTLKNGVAVFEGITLEDDVFCGVNVVFINDRYPRSHRQGQWTLEKTLIKKGATLGSNATILCGITVGEYAVVGAGSIVTQDVPAHAIFIGNPAKFKGYSCRCGRPLGVTFRCSCGLRYDLNAQGLRIHA
jgi:acetyltransferase-like isoleucine patch superfamily enzyme